MSESVLSLQGFGTFVSEFISFQKTASTRAFSLVVYVTGSGRDHLSKQLHFQYSQRESTKQPTPKLSLCQGRVIGRSIFKILLSCLDMGLVFRTLLPGINLTYSDYVRIFHSTVHCRNIYRALYSGGSSYSENAQKRK